MWGLSQATSKIIVSYNRIKTKTSYAKENFQRRIQLQQLYHLSNEGIYFKPEAGIAYWLEQIEKNTPK